MKDLFVLVADKNMDFLMRGLLPRIPVIENVMAFTFDILVHPYRDSGIFNESDDFLRPFSTNYTYALVILDHHGSGREQIERGEVEHAISHKLNISGWKDRNVVICIDPELENWIWVNETRIKEAISWEREPGLYEWLHLNKWKTPSEPKPKHPKEAFEAAIRLSNTPRSSSLYRSIASQANYRNCQDAAFQKMLLQLREWFTAK